MLTKISMNELQSFVYFAEIVKKNVEEKKNSCIYFRIAQCLILPIFFVYMALEL